MGYFMDFFFAIRDYLAAGFYLAIKIMILIIVKNFIVFDIQRSYIMMLSNGNIFRVTSLCVEATGPQ